MSTEYLLSQIKNVRVAQTQVNRKVKDLINDFKKGEIFIPEYQRAFVWDNSVQSRFIESIFMNIPIPPLFLLEKYNEETGDIKYEVIDGVQRLSTLLSFCDSNLKLSSGLKLSDLERMNFQKLPPPLMNIFLNREITTLKIERTTHPEIQFEIFERLNRGSVSLSHQELRNCMYNGEFNNFLLDLNKKDIYKELLSSFSQFKSIVIGEPSKNRMLDIEMILRFFTLYESFIETGKYVSPKKEQLNFYMRIKKEREKNILKEEFEDSYSKSNEELEEIFIKSCMSVKSVFGDKAFRRFKTTKTEIDFIGFNKAVFDIQMLGFIDYSIDDIQKMSEIIYTEFLNLSSFNEIFIDSINRSTDHKINERIEIWKDILLDIITNPSFYEEKIQNHKEIFNQKPECIYCNKQIKSFDESYFQKKTVELYHKSCYLNIISDKGTNKRKSSSIFKFRWIDKDYEKNISECLELVCNDIAKIIEDNNFHIEKFLSFEFIGEIEILRNKNNQKTKVFKPLKPIKNINKILFIDTSYDKQQNIDNLLELVSCFGLSEKFIIL